MINAALNYYKKSTGLFLCQSLISYTQHKMGNFKHILPIHSTNTEEIKSKDTEIQTKTRIHKRPTNSGILYNTGQPSDSVN